MTDQRIPEGMIVDCHRLDYFGPTADGAVRARYVTTIIDAWSRQIVFWRISQEHTRSHEIPPY